MKSAAKLFDLHNKTIEALVHYRSKGGQQISVIHQHVKIEEGGRAIVGAVSQRGGSN